MNKDTITDKIIERLKSIKRSDGFFTDMGLSVEYGSEEPEWRDREGLQYLDNFDRENENQSHFRDLTFLISACGYGKRPELLKVGREIEADVIKVLGQCCTSQASISIEKDLRISGEQSAILITFTVELKIDALPSSRG